MISREHIHKVVLRLPDSWSNWNFELLVFEERGKTECPKKNLSEQRREPTTTISISVALVIKFFFSTIFLINEGSTVIG